MTAALALISGLPREELQSLTKEISTLMASSPKEKVKRVAAVGQKAWFAFMRHCRDTMADRFTAGLKAPEIAVICKAIRAEDEAVYTAFVEKFKVENPAPSAPAPAAPSDAPAPAVAPAIAPAPKPVSKPVAKASAKLTAEEKEAEKVAKALEKEQKAAAKSAEKEAKSAEKQQKAATKSAEKAAEKEAARLAKEGARLAKEAEKEAAKQQKAAEKEAAKQAKLAAKPTKAKAKAKPTAPISAEATPAPAEPEEDVMPKITIGGVAYFHDESSNGLYGIDAATNGLSHWVGYFQPDNEAQPIRYTASEGDDE
jgi:hypothetical protein